MSYKALCNLFMLLYPRPFHCHGDITFCHQGSLQNIAVAKLNQIYYHRFKPSNLLRMTRSIWTH